MSRTGLRTIRISLPQLSLNLLFHNDDNGLEAVATGLRSLPTPCPCGEGAGLQIICRLCAARLAVCFGPCKRRELCHPPHTGREMLPSPNHSASPGTIAPSGDRNPVAISKVTLAQPYDVLHLSQRPSLLKLRPLQWQR